MGELWWSVVLKQWVLWEEVRGSTGARNRRFWPFLGISIRTTQGAGGRCHFVSHSVSDLTGRLSLFCLWKSFLSDLPVIILTMRFSTLVSYSRSCWECSWLGICHTAEVNSLQALTEEKKEPWSEEKSKNKTTKTKNNRADQCFHFQGTVKKRRVFHLFCLEKESKEF